LVSPALKVKSLPADRLLASHNIDVYLAKDLSVSDLAGDACLSLYHFGRMFRYSIGESVHQYVTRRRIKRAQALLRPGILRLSEIAEAVGFSDQSHSRLYSDITWT
jgi:AraC family transcriptional regulator